MVNASGRRGKVSEVAFGKLSLVLVSEDIQDFSTETRHDLFWIYLVIIKQHDGNWMVCIMVYYEVNRVTLKALNSILESILDFVFCWLVGVHLFEFILHHLGNLNDSVELEGQVYWVHSVDWIIIVVHWFLAKLVLGSYEWAVCYIWFNVGVDEAHIRLADRRQTWRHNEVMLVRNAVDVNHTVFELLALVLLFLKQFILDQGWPLPGCWSLTESSRM